MADKISSVIAHCISSYASFYAGLSCCDSLESLTRVGQVKPLWLIITVGQCSVVCDTIIITVDHCFVVGDTIINTVNQCSVVCDTIIITVDQCSVVGDTIIITVDQCSVVGDTFIITIDQCSVVGDTIINTIDQCSVVGDTFPVGCAFSNQIVFGTESFADNPDFAHPVYRYIFWRRLSADPSV